MLFAICIESILIIFTGSKMDEDELSDDERMQICEVCQLERFYILKHLKASKECKEKYSSEGLKTLHEIARKRRNARRRGRYNPASESKRKKERYDATKVSERNKKYWEKNKPQLTEKMLKKYHHEREKLKVSMNPDKSGTILMRSTLVLKHFDLKEGPIYPCLCCSGMNYEEGVTKVTEFNDYVANDALEKYADLEEENAMICHNCFWHLKYYNRKANVTQDSVAPFCLPKRRDYFNRRCPELAILFSTFTLQKMPDKLLKSSKDTKHAQVIDYRHTDCNKSKWSNDKFKTFCHGFLLAFGEWKRPEDIENPFHPFKYCLCYLKVLSDGNVSFTLAKTKPDTYDASIWMQKFEDLGYLEVREITPALELMKCNGTEEEKNYLIQKGFNDLVFLYDWE